MCLACDLSTSFLREDARIVGVPVRYGWSDKTSAVMLASLASPQDLYQVSTVFYNRIKGNRNAQSNLLLSALESYPIGFRWLANMASVQTYVELALPKSKRASERTLQYRACCGVFPWTSSFILLSRFADMNMAYVQVGSAERELESRLWNPTLHSWLEQRK